MRKNAAKSVRLRAPGNRRDGAAQSLFDPMQRADQRRGCFSDGRKPGRVSGRVRLVDRSGHALGEGAKRRRSHAARRITNRRLERLSRVVQAPGEGKPQIHTCGQRQPSGISPLRADETIEPPTMTNGSDPHHAERESEKKHERIEQRKRAGVGPSRQRRLEARIPPVGVVAFDLAVRQRHEKQRRRQNDRCGLEREESAAHRLI